MTTLTLRVTPRAKNTAITEITDELIRIRIQSPPVDGKANKALLKFMATKLGLKRRQIRITAGESSRNKQLTLSGITPQQLLERLGADD